MVGARNRTGQEGGQRIQRVAAGLFVLRYASSTERRRPPRVAVEVDPGSKVTVLCDHPPRSAVMQMPGDAVVVHALKDTYVRIVVEPSVPGGSTDAQLVLERVSCSLSPSQVEAVDEQPMQPSTGLGSVSLLAHVSRRGDVTARAGDWICGPNSPLAIEGLEIIWPDRPAGVDILTSAVISLNGRRVQPPVRVGQFVGTRQKAAPIVGLTLNLTGPAAHLYSLNVEALFLGGAILNRSGVFVELAGQSGLEALVGLKLSVVSLVEEDVQDWSVLASRTPTEARASGSRGPAPYAPEPATTRPAADNRNSVLLAEQDTLPKSSRVRIFRAPRPPRSSDISVD